MLIVDMLHILFDVHLNCLRFPLIVFSLPLFSFNLIYSFFIECTFEVCCVILLLLSLQLILFFKQGFSLLQCLKVLNLMFFLLRLPLISACWNFQTSQTFEMCFPLLNLCLFLFLGYLLIFNIGRSRPILSSKYCFGILLNDNLVLLPLIKKQFNIIAYLNPLLFSLFLLFVFQFLIFFFFLNLLLLHSQFGLFLQLPFSFNLFVV